MLEALRRRGSPAHDGLAARMVSFRQTGDGLALELQPIRWALRLLSADAGDSISALCVVRDVGRQLVGRPPGGVGRVLGWALGARRRRLGRGRREPDRHAHARAREEWSVGPERLQVEALVRLGNGMVMFVGQAWLPSGATVTPDDEHDEFAWWPADVDALARRGRRPLRAMAALLASH